MRQINFVMIVVGGERDINYKIEGSVYYWCRLDETFASSTKTEEHVFEIF